MVSLCAMMYGLAISLLDSTLVQSPLRLSACAHMHIQVYSNGASSDARLATTRGSGPGPLQQVDTVSARLSERVILSSVCHTGSWFRGSGHGTGRIYVTLKQVSEVLSMGSA
jgi:hypothetical protein